MTGRVQRTVAKGWPSCAFALAIALLSGGPAWSASALTLAWSANSEGDLAGYLVKYGTSAGTYSQIIDVGQVTTYQIQNLSASTTYYLVVEAYDTSGNVSLPSAEVSGMASVVAGPPPTVTSAVEISSGSTYILQSGNQMIRVSGSGFQGGAVVDLGAGISSGATSSSGSTKLTLTITIGPAATLGPRTLTVTNPDTGTGSKASALTVVRTVDIDRDCLIDAGDLNAIARAYQTTSLDPAYIAAADLDGDSRVDGNDLALFVLYFGQRLAVCP